MSVARALITEHPLGRTLGAPGDAERQRAVIETALELFTTSEPTIREFALPYRAAPPLDRDPELAERFRTGTRESGSWTAATGFPSA